MNLFQLRAFDAVAREGSFTRAAARLFISQPAVTGHIKALEEHYQITLLRRTARRVELTEEGTKLAAITRAMFGLAEEAQVMLEANRQLLTGRLEVAADGPHMVMPMLASLRARYPGITVNLRLGNAQETLAALLSEHADVAVLTEVEPRKGLHLQDLSESRICALVPDGHPWAQMSEGGAAQGAGSGDHGVARAKFDHPAHLRRGVRGGVGQSTGVAGAGQSRGGDRSRRRRVGGWRGVVGGGQPRPEGGGGADYW